MPCLYNRYFGNDEDNYYCGIAAHALAGLIIAVPSTTLLLLLYYYSTTPPPPPPSGRKIQAASQYTSMSIWLSASSHTACTMTGHFAATAAIPASSYQMSYLMDRSDNRMSGT